jgi:hypothetical protein
MNLRTLDPPTTTRARPGTRAACTASAGPTTGGPVVGVGVLKELTVSVRAAFASVPVSSLSSSDVDAAMRHVSALQRATAAFDLSLRARAKELQPQPESSLLPDPPEADNTPPPEPDTGPSVDVSPDKLDEIAGDDSHTGKLKDRMARVLKQMPAIAHALACGDIAEAHVVKLANEMFRATTPAWTALIAEQDDLASAARRMQPGAFARHVSAVLQRIAFHLNGATERDLDNEISASHWIDTATGMGRLTATFSPAAYARIVPLLASLTNRIMGTTAGITKKQATGRALVQLLTQDPAGAGSTSGSVLVSTSAMPPIAVLIDERTLFDGPHPGTICERPDGSRVPVNQAKEMACNSQLIPILHDSFGNTLDVGRSKRYNTPAQRIAQMAMYNTCFHTACEVPITDCNGHHITYWDKGGRTDMNNLIPVCQNHHRWIHTHNPTITLDQHRVATIVMPNGTTTTHHPNRRPPRQAKE